MTKSAGLLVAAALLGAGLVSIREDGRPATPFWQLHGAAPAAGETDSMGQLRQASRPKPTLVAGLP